MVELPRGIRNKNPGNVLCDGSTHWEGSVGHDKQGFLVFSNAYYGCRCLRSVLNTYVARHNLRTIRGIIGRYAPYPANNTNAYVDSVSRQTGIPPDQVLDIPYDYAALCRAIIVEENGCCPYDNNTIMGMIPATPAASLQPEKETIT